jgi:hypothetical protein
VVVQLDHHPICTEKMATREKENLENRLSTAGYPCTPVTKVDFSLSPRSID